MFKDVPEDFQSLRNDLISFALSILRNREDAEDVIQEVFGECLKSNRTSFEKPYLYRSVRNRSLNKIRSYKRFQMAVERFADYLGLIEEEKEKPSLLRVLDRLPEKQREVLVMRIKGELKISEIAEVLEIPQGTVKSRLNKALKYLRNNVQGYEL